MSSPDLLDWAEDPHGCILLGQFGQPLPHIGLQEKLEAREPLEIDSFFDSTRDRLEKKQAEFEHFM